MVVEPTPGRNKLLQPSPHRDGVLQGGVDGLVAVSGRRSGRSAGQGLRVSVASVSTVATAVSNKYAPDSSLLVRELLVDGGPVSCLSGRGWRSGDVDLGVDFVSVLRCRGDACSDVDVELWTLYRSILFAAVPSGKLLQVLKLAFAGVDLTVGVLRGESPADVVSLLLQSRLCRVALAAISTRLCPLKVLSGDSAAASCCLAFVSDGTGRFRRAVADRACSRRTQGLSCYFTFLQGYFCTLLTAVSALDDSCTVFLA